MNSKQLVWLAQAEEVSAPIEVAEQFTVFSLADLEAEQALFTQIWAEQEAEIAAYFESHPHLAGWRVA